MPGQVSCPRCDAPASARARTCAGCGFRFLEEGRPARRPFRRAVPPAAGALAAVAVVVTVLIRAGGETSHGVRSAPGPEVLSAHPLSARAAERRLEARFTSLRDDDSAGVHCSQRHPEPAHAVRHCRISYPNGAQRTVVLMMNARGRELLIGP